MRTKSDYLVEFNQTFSETLGSDFPETLLRSDFHNFTPTLNSQSGLDDNFPKFEERSLNPARGMKAVKGSR